MPAVTSMDPAAILEARNTTFVAGYNALFGQKKLTGGYELWTRKIETKTKTVKLGMLTNTPQMRRWRGMRQAKTPRGYEQSMTIDVFEATVDLARVDVMYDQTGLFDSWIQGFLTNGLQAYDQVMNALWTSNGGAGPTGYDNVAVFSAAHPHARNGGTNSNLATGTALSYSSIRTALYNSAAWTQENGEPYLPNFDTIEVGEFNRLPAEELFAVDRIVAVNAAGAFDATSGNVAAAGRSNGLGKAMKIAVNKRLDNISGASGYVTLIDTSMADIKPMNLLEARFPEPILENQMQSHRRVREDRYYIGLDGDFDGAGGAWQTAYRLTP